MTKPQVAVLGVPMDLGQSRRGVDMGPSALRYTGFEASLAALGYEVLDLGDVRVPVAESLHGGDPLAKGGMAYLDAIRRACEEIVNALRLPPAGAFPIVLGGDHSVAMGSVPGASRGERVGVIWVDAHTDFNTAETSPSRNIHGMPLAALCGLGDPRLVDIAWKGAKVRPEDVVMLGIRSVDRGERDLVRQAGIAVYTMKEVDRLGIPRIAEEVVARLKPLSRVHVSLDADVLDPEIAPGVGTPIPGGLTYREAHLLMELLADAGIVTSLDLVEVNPILDRENRTAVMMVELAASLLGRRIL
ncbi:MAG TPA: arginase [Thermoanaerobaculaceae bacterium]|nr:arginase [Thermoanaerobaculaceae bacterium]